jgi:predicted phage gp36 major capsid-like protein
LALKLLVKVAAKPFVEFYTRKRVGGDVVDFDAYVAMVIST